MAKKIAPKAPVVNIKKRVSSKPYAGKQVIAQNIKIKDMSNAIKADTVKAVKPQVKQMNKKK